MPNPLATIFVNFDGETGGVHNGRTRKQVRSEAAKWSHRSTARKPKTSKKLRAHAQMKARASSSASNSTGSKNAKSKESIVAVGTIAKDDIVDESCGLVTSNATEAAPRPAQPQVQSAQSSGDEPTASSNSSRDGHPSADTASSTSDRGPFRKRSPSPSTYLPKAVEVEHCWPVPFQPFYPRLIDYMWPFMVRGWSRMPTKEEERDETLVWVQRLTYSDPCYFYMNMLSVATDLSSRNMIDGRIAVWLLAQTVSTINQALCDAQRRLAVGTILTVGRIALHEITLGDREAGKFMHRPAQVRMLNMAGGLEALDLPPLVKKHVLWADRLMAMQTGIAMIPVHPSRTLVEEHSTGKDADLRVLDAYMPVRSRGNGRI